MKPSLTIAPPQGATTIKRTEAELFEPFKKAVWRRGEVTRPNWLKRENGYDYIQVKERSKLTDVRRYLAGEDDRLMVEDYNAFITMRDKQDNPMIILQHLDDVGEAKKVAMIVIVDQSLSLDVVALVDEFCKEA